MRGYTCVCCSGYGTSCFSRDCMRNGGVCIHQKQQAQYTGVVGKMQYYVHRYAGLAILCQAVRAIDPAPVWGK